MGGLICEAPSFDTQKGNVLNEFRNAGMQLNTN